MIAAQGFGRGSTGVLMIISDDFDVGSLRQSLAEDGIRFRVECFDDAANAIDHLKHRNFEIAGGLVILLDLDSALGGHEDLVAEIRKDRWLCRSVILVMSASGDRGRINAAYDQNVAGYIVKHATEEHNQNLVRLLRDYCAVVTLSGLPRR
ncbi:hypothetical protein P775_25110 [Puniceibacterium antarcticum]|uniref:Response regulatory domain-containing protein n=1 Tax=Puniceibacterium antarcticum TaxID=1206336 RepID=A0A2G8R3Z0_9RHOB|nr:hypothetical protein [Puniceibacterium antarcticum]PIL16243.1 hypothetical protein P775_25110 [Puniceibacterium antarcticum]